MDQARLPIICHDYTLLYIPFFPILRMYGHCTTMNKRGTKCIVTIARMWSLEPRNVQWVHVLLLILHRQGTTQQNRDQVEKNTSLAKLKLQILWHFPPTNLIQLKYFIGIFSRKSQRKFFGVFYQKYPWETRLVLDFRQC